MGRRIRAAWGVVLLALVLTGTVLAPATSASAASRPIRGDYFGVQDDSLRNASPAWGAARIWGAWCTVQPTAGTDVKKSADRALGRAFALNGLAERSRVTVHLGHPAPWVFGNHPQAAKGGNKNVWYCKAKRSVTAFPSAKSLRSGRVRAAYTAYVAAVIKAAKPYLSARKSNKLVLQAWNEPNLGSGGRVKYKIPGAARTWTQAAESLRQQERVMRQVAQSLIPGRFEISSPAMYGKPTKLGTPYFRLQAKKRTVDSFSLNFYTLRVKTVNGSLSQWRSKASRAKRLVTRYKALRSVPIWITETNHSLVNVRGDKRNQKATWSAPAAQRRLVEVTTLEAMRLGFAGIEWYQGTTRQTAVNTRPGTPATVATRQLRTELEGRRLLSCSSRKGVSVCTFSARKGSKSVKVRWTSGGSRGVTILR